MVSESQRFALAAAVTSSLGFALSECRPPPLLRSGNAFPRFRAQDPLHSGLLRGPASGSSGFLRRSAYTAAQQ